MARKPCAQNVEQLILDCSFECLPKGRFRRIAQNAILPFYYDRNRINENGEYKKVFYIKNPAFFSGTAANVPTNFNTQAMQYSRLSQNPSQGPRRNRTTVQVRNIVACEVPAATSNDWRELYFGGYQIKKIGEDCGCRPGANKLQQYTSLQNRLI